MDAYQLQAAFTLQHSVIQSMQISFMPKSLWTAGIGHGELGRERRSREKKRQCQLGGYKRMGISGKSWGRDGCNENTTHAVLKELIKFTLKIIKYKQYPQQAKFHISMKTFKYTVMNRL